MSEALVLAAEVTAGHDGEADLSLTVQYENGVTGVVTLDAASAFEILESCGVASAADLIGLSWRQVLQGV
jgi:RNase P/RNase MRP subunit p30